MTTTNRKRQHNSREYEVKRRRLNHREITPNSILQRLFRTRFTEHLPNPGTATTTTATTHTTLTPRTATTRGRRRRVRKSRSATTVATTTTPSSSTTATDDTTNATRPRRGRNDAIAANATLDVGVARPATATARPATGTGAAGLRSVATPRPRELLFTRLSPLFCCSSTAENRCEDSNF